MSRHEISFNTHRSGSIKIRADFIYHMGSDWITIADTGKGKSSVADDLESVLRKIEYWHQGSIAKFKIMCREATSFGGSKKSKGCPKAKSSNGPPQDY
jgi:hypothetical protein